MGFKFKESQKPSQYRNYPPIKINQLKKKMNIKVGSKEFPTLFLQRIIPAVSNLSHLA